MEVYLSDKTNRTAVASAYNTIVEMQLTSKEIRFSTSIPPYNDIIAWWGWLYCDLIPVGSKSRDGDGFDILMASAPASINKFKISYHRDWSSSSLWLPKRMSPDLPVLMRVCSEIQLRVTWCWGRRCVGVIRDRRYKVEEEKWNDNSIIPLESDARNITFDASSWLDSYGVSTRKYILTGHEVK